MLQVAKELSNTKARVIDLEMANQKQEHVIAESAGHICRLKDDLAAARDQHRQHQIEGAWAADICVPSDSSFAS